MAWAGRLCALGWSPAVVHTGIWRTTSEAGLMPGVPLLGCRKWSELSTDPAQLRVHSTGQTGAQGAVGQGEQSCPYSPSGHPKPLTSDLKPPPTHSPPRLQSLDLAHVHPVSLEELLELVTH